MLAARRWMRAKGSPRVLTPAAADRRDEIAAGLPIVSAVDPAAQCIGHEPQPLTINSSGFEAVSLRRGVSIT